MRKIKYLCFLMIIIYNCWLHSSAWLEHRPLKAGVGGSNPPEAI